MWSIFPYADLPSIHLLLGSVCLGLLPLFIYFFNQIVAFLIVECSKFFVHFG